MPTRLLSRRVFRVSRVGSRLILASNGDSVTHFTFAEIASALRPGDEIEQLEYQEDTPGGQRHHYWRLRLHTGGSPHAS
jgi:hypothetical protein